MVSAIFHSLDCLQIARFHQLVREADDVMAAYCRIQSIMQTSTPFAHAGVSLHVISARMPSSTRSQADTKMSVSSLPSDVLQRICSFPEDPDDLASCHLVDTRCVRHAWCARTSAHTVQSADLVGRDAPMHQPAGPGQHVYAIFRMTVWWHGAGFVLLPGLR